MPMVMLKCPQCGGELQFEDDREFGFCQYCGAKVMIEKNANINSFRSDVININYNTAPQSRMLDCELYRDKRATGLFRFFILVDGFDAAELWADKSKKISLTAGPHSIVVRANNFKDYATTVTVTANTRLVFGYRGMFKRTFTIKSEPLAYTGQTGY